MKMVRSYHNCKRFISLRLTFFPLFKDTANHQLTQHRPFLRFGTGTSLYHTTLVESSGIHLEFKESPARSIIICVRFQSDSEQQRNS